MNHEASLLSTPPQTHVLSCETWHNQPLQKFFTLRKGELRSWFIPELRSWDWLQATLDRTRVGFEASHRTDSLLCTGARVLRFMKESTFTQDS